jgi:hypothetical protein
MSDTDANTEQRTEALGDAALFHRCRDGERAAWVEVVRRRQRLVYTVARRAGCGEADAAAVLRSTCDTSAATGQRIAAAASTSAAVCTIAALARPARL